jgi:hypothetical protein
MRDGCHCPLISAHGSPAQTQAPPLERFAALFVDCHLRRGDQDLDEIAPSFTKRERIAVRVYSALGRDPERRYEPNRRREDSNEECQIPHRQPRAHAIGLELRPSQVPHDFPILPQRDERARSPNDDQGQAQVARCLWTGGVRTRGGLLELLEEL